MNIFNTVIDKISLIPEISGKVDLVDVYVFEGVVFCEINERPIECKESEECDAHFHTDDAWELKTETGTIPVRIIVNAANAGIPLEDSIFCEAKIWMDKVKDILQFHLYDYKI